MLVPFSVLNPIVPVSGMLPVLLARTYGHYMETHYCTSLSPLFLPKLSFPVMTRRPGGKQSCTTHGIFVFVEALRGGVAACCACVVAVFASTSISPFLLYGPFLKARSEPCEANETLKNDDASPLPPWVGVVMVAVGMVVVVIVVWVMLVVVAEFWSLGYCTPPFLCLSLSGPLTKKQPDVIGFHI